METLDYPYQEVCDYLRCLSSLKDLEHEAPNSRTAALALDALLGTAGELRHRQRLSDYGDSATLIALTITRLSNAS